MCVLTIINSTCIILYLLIIDTTSITTLVTLPKVASDGVHVFVHLDLVWLICLEVFSVCSCSLPRSRDSPSWSSWYEGNYGWCHSNILLRAWIPTCWWGIHNLSQYWCVEQSKTSVQENWLVLYNIYNVYLCTCVYAFAHASILLHYRQLVVTIVRLRKQVNNTSGDSIICNLSSNNFVCIRLFTCYWGALISGAKIVS